MTTGRTAAFVYVVSAGEGAQKVGIATGDPFNRLAVLETSSPLRLHLAGHVEVQTQAEARAVERAVHDLLKPARTMGEWFAVTPDAALSAVQRVSGRVAVRPSPREKYQRAGRRLRKVRRTAAFGIRVEPAVKQVVEQVAAADRRTVASLVEKVLAEWLEANGYLPKAGGGA